MKSEPITGDCTNSPNPDLWFPEPPNGRPSHHKMSALAGQILEAINICKGCPSRQKCLEDGMEPININEGIWGGLMAGERLKLKGYKSDSFYADSTERDAILFAERIAPFIRGEV